MKITYKTYYDFPFLTGELEEGKKMFGTQRLTSLTWAEYKPEHDVLIKEHNQLLKEIEERFSRMKDIANKIKGK